MSDEVLERFTRQLLRPADLATATKPEPEEFDDYGAFGWLRGVRERVPMIELRQKDGNIRAHGYAWLHQAEFDPSVGIVLSFGTFQVTLTGRNLNAEVRPHVRLFQGIVRQRVSYVQEADEATILRSQDHETVIERIVWA